MDCSTIFAKNFCMLVTLPLKLLASVKSFQPNSGRNWLKKVDHHEPNKSMKTVHSKKHPHSLKNRQAKQPSTVDKIEPNGI